jgi:formylglycine-generating enzyme
MLDGAVALANEILRLDARGRPACCDRKAIMRAVGAVLDTGHEEAIAEILMEGFLRDSEARYAEYVQPRMLRLPARRFEMGTHASRARHFCGETPRHSVEVSAFQLADTTVTSNVFGLLDQQRADVRAEERDHPVVAVTWFDAAVFAMWVGCRLPTEAEWERACGDGRSHEWCCEDEGDLPRFGWFSENANGRLHTVAAKSPNELGLYDMHGNVWEWCQDVYDQDYYSRSPKVDPANVGEPSVRPPTHVCRGGSMHSLSEMCRTRYRLHDPPELSAYDLGFRLARDAVGDGSGT